MKTGVGQRRLGHGNGPHRRRWLNFGALERWRLELPTAPTVTTQLLLEGHNDLFVVGAIGDALQNCVVKVVGGVTA